MKYLHLSILLLVGFCAAQGEDAYRGYKVHRLFIDTQEQLDFLIRTRDDLGAESIENEVQFWSDLPTFLGENQSVLVMLSPGATKQFLTDMEAQSIRHVVTVQDLADTFAEESRLAEDDLFAVENGGMTFTAYHRYATYEKWLKNLVSTYPAIIKEYKMIGRSYEGREMHLIKIGARRDDDQQRPAIWMDGAIHSREWLAGTTLAWIVNKLVTEYGTNATVTQMVDQIDWYIVPVVNVDGFEYSHQSRANRLWRITRQVSPFSPKPGADPNRNFDHYWMYAGADQVSGAQTYAGGQPFSEIEDLHLTEALLERKKTIKAYFNFHCCAETWLTPWGYAKTLSDVPTDNPDIVGMAEKAMRALEAVHGVHYGVGTPFKELGSAGAGGTIDWAKAKAGIKYAYAPELRVATESGFIHPPSYIIPSGEETFEAIHSFAEDIFAEFGPFITDPPIV